MLDATWAIDNDQGSWLEDLPEGLGDLVLFVSATNTQTAATLHDDLEVAYAYGVFDIPAIGSKPARANVACYRAVMPGAAITERLTVAVKTGSVYAPYYYGISKSGQQYREVFRIRVIDPREAVKA